MNIGIAALFAGTIVATSAGTYFIAKSENASVEIKEVILDTPKTASVTFTSVEGDLKLAVKACEALLPMQSQILMGYTRLGYTKEAIDRKTAELGDSLTSCKNMFQTPWKKWQPVFAQNETAASEWNKIMGKANAAFDSWGDWSSLTYNGNGEIHFTQRKAISDTRERLLENLAVFEIQNTAIIESTKVVQAEHSKPQKSGS